MENLKKIGKTVLVAAAVALLQEATKLLLSQK